mmetsp:Transcript_10073/g.17321  ORF Transcript_10073/g.17321 Transcript_10073/m.17321 type:complete len:302 (+) Transcript_10073:842-1747(+)
MPGQVWCPTNWEVLYFSLPQVAWSLSNSKLYGQWQVPLVSHRPTPLQTSASLVPSSVSRSTVAVPLRLFRLACTRNAGALPKVPFSTTRVVTFPLFSQSWEPPPAMVTDWTWTWPAARLGRAARAAARSAAPAFQATGAVVCRSYVSCTAPSHPGPQVQVRVWVVRNQAWPASEESPWSDSGGRSPGIAANAMAVVVPPEEQTVVPPVKFTWTGPAAAHRSASPKIRGLAVRAAATAASLASWAIRAVACALYLRRKVPPAAPHHSVATSSRPPGVRGSLLRAHSRWPQLLPPHPGSHTQP